MNKQQLLAICKQQPCHYNSERRNNYDSDLKQEEKV